MKQPNPLKFRIEGDELRIDFSEMNLPIHRENSCLLIFSHIKDEVWISIFKDDNAKEFMSFVIDGGLRNGHWKTI